MPVDPTVTPGTTPGSNVNVTGDMKDTPPGGKQSFNAHVVFTVDKTHVSFVSASPPGYKTVVTGNAITVTWRKFPFNAKKAKHSASVQLACKRNAYGPTPFAWTYSSLNDTYPAWGGCASIIYHDPSHCRQKRGLKKPGS